MKYFKWYVLSAFIITIKRKRTYKRSRYPYRAVLQRPCSPLDIKYLVQILINTISIILYRYLRLRISDMIVVEIFAGTLNTMLLCMMITLLLNFLVRPVLWTNFNVVILVYFCLNIILGAFNISLLAKITIRNFSSGKPSKTIKQYLKPGNCGLHCS